MATYMEEVFSQIELEKAEADARKLAELQKKQGDPDFVERMHKFGAGLANAIKEQGHTMTEFDYPTLRVRMLNGIARDMNIPGTTKEQTMIRLKEVGVKM